MVSGNIFQGWLTTHDPPLTTQQLTNTMIFRWFGTVLRSIFHKGPEYKSPRELAMMRDSGKVVAEALRLCHDMAKPGVRTYQINEAVEALFNRHDVLPLF